MDYKKIAESCKNCVSYKCEDCGYKKHLPTCECADKLMIDASIAITELLARAENAEKQLAQCEPKHGHWEVSPLYPAAGKRYRCSHCKEENKYITDYLVKLGLEDKYCKNCGAKMDEEKK